MQIPLQLLGASFSWNNMLDVIADIYSGVSMGVGI